MTHELRPNAATCAAAAAAAVMSVVTFPMRCLAQACLVKARSRNSDLMWTHQWLNSENRLDCHLGVAGVPCS